MKLIPNALAKLLHADSMIGLVLLWATALFPYLAYQFGYETDPNTWFWWALFMPPIVLVLGVLDQGIAAGVPKRRWWRTALKYLIYGGIMIALVAWSSRIYAMDQMQPTVAPIGGARVDPLAPTTEAAVVRFCGPYIDKWEGERLTAYIPVKGDRPTICMGATQIEGVPVVMGQTATHEQCVAIRDMHIREYRAGLHRALTAETIRTRLTVARDCAFASLTINIGAAAAARSTAVKRLNAGWIEGACEAAQWFNRSGGVIYRGLTIRRGEESVLCLAGLE